MIIRKVSLKNIKSYREAEVELPEGITGVTGLNGSGKSTMLESIGYALFDCLPYTQSEFVRKGEKTGEVTVDIEGDDGLRYVVTRKCGSSQAYFLIDSLGNRFDGKEDVEDLLCKVLGYRVTGFDGLRSMFENAVGVLQGTFVSEFLESSTKRKGIFDPLLHVDEYNVAYKNLISLKNLVKGRIDSLENEKSRLIGRTEKLAHLREEQAGLALEVKSLSSEAIEKRRQLEETSAKKGRFDITEKSIQKLDSQLSLSGAEVKGKKLEVSEIGLQLQTCEAAETKLKDSEPGYKAYTSKLSEKESLEKKCLERDELLRVNTGTISKVAACRTKLSAAEKILHEIVMAEKEIPSLMEKATVQERLDEEKQKIMATVRAKDIELEQIRERVSKARGSKGNTCPVLMNVECGAVKDFSSYFADQTSRIQGERKLLEEQASRVDKSLRELQNPRLALSVRQEHVKKKGEASEEKEKIEKELESANLELQQQLSELKRYGHVQKSMDQANKDIAAHKSAYETYQQNIRIAGQKETLLQKLRNTTASLNKALEELAIIEKQLEEIKRLYDRDAHVKASADCESLNRELASVSARLDEKSRRATAVAEDLRKMGEDLKRIEEIKADQVSESDYLRFVEMSRGVLKLAGPEIVKIFIDLISGEATEMYSEISGDRSIEIRWTPDYEILMIENGRERSFKQMSGGERMSAALAVRLAILKILTNSDVVFLDEPTQNMDEPRRQNLAQEITRIKDFRQMVVISHDDTFNANLENVIEIEKINGESSVRRPTVARS